MSTLPPDCQQLLISGYVLGDLSPAEALLFEEMLSVDPSLAEQVTAMQQALDAVYIPAEVSPPTALRDRILTTANAQKTEPIVEPTATPDPEANVEANTEATDSSSSTLAKILGAIALAIIALLGIANYRLWQTARTTDIESPTAQNTYLLEGEDVPETTSARLVVNRDRLNATLIANDLPTLPPDKVYALWTVVGNDVPYTTDEKGAILTAVFKVNESGDLEREIAVPQPHLEPRTINKMAITVEDRAAPQAHTGSIFLSTGG